MTKKTNRIILTGENAKQFKKIIDNPDPGIRANRNAFLKDVVQTTSIRHEDSRTVVIFTEKK